MCILTTGGFKSPGRGRGGGPGMRGGKKVIIEAHRHEGTEFAVKPCIHRINSCPQC